MKKTESIRCNACVGGACWVCAARNRWRDVHFRRQAVGFFRAIWCRLMHGEYHTWSPVYYSWRVSCSKCDRSWTVDE